MRQKGSTEVWGLTLSVLLGTGRICHPQRADLGGQDVQGLRTLLVPPSSWSTSQGCIQASLAHLPQPLFIWKADASRLSLSEHRAPGLLSPGASPSSWGWGVGGWESESYSPLGAWVTGSPLLSGFQAPMFAWSGERGELPRRAQQASLPK